MIDVHGIEVLVEVHANRHGQRSFCRGENDDEQADNLTVDVEILGIADIPTQA